MTCGCSTNLKEKPSPGASEELGFESNPGSFVADFKRCPGHGPPDLLSEKDKQTQVPEHLPTQLSHCFFVD